MIANKLQMTGVYQTLSGCALQIKKQAMAIKIIYEVYATISKKSWNPLTIKRSIIDKKNVNKDHAHAGYTSKYDSSPFFPMILSFNYYFYLA